MPTQTQQRKSIHVKLDRDTLNKIDSLMGVYGRSEFIRSVTAIAANQLTKTLEGTSK